jgi:hypothetical protein
MSLNILLAANPITPLNVDDQWASDRLTAAGHTVTTVLDNVAAPSLSGYDLIVFCRSTSQTQLSTKYDGFTAGGIVGLGSFPHSKYSTANTASTGAVTTGFVLVNGDFLAAGATGTVTLTSVAATLLYQINTDFGAACVLVFAQSSGITTRIWGSHYDTGAVMSDGSTTAPSRRVHLGMPSGYANFTAATIAMFDAAVNWAVTGLVAKPTSASAHVLSTVTLSGSATGVTGTASWLWNHVSGPSTNGSLSSTTAQSPTYTAPASAVTPDVWSLTVTDSGTGSTSTPSNATITYINTAPSAATGGPYSQQATGTPTSTTVDVNLNGTASVDPEGSVLSHSWRVISSTASSATLINATTSAPVVRVAKYGGLVTVGNTVTDSGGVASTEVTTTVRVYPVAYKWYTHNGLLLQRQRFTAHNGSLS